MLRQPGSVLVTDADEVVELVSAIGEAPAPRKSGRTVPRDRLDATARRVLDATPLAAAAPTGSIATEAGLAPAEAVAVLGRLAAAGLVERLGNGWRVAPPERSAP
jgi:DNA processing protein